MRRWMIGVVAAGTLAACGDDDKKVTDTADSVEVQAEVETIEPDATDTAEPETADTASPDTTPDTGETAIVYEKPDHFPDKSDADEVLTFDALTQPVRVVYDNRGIPHIYGQNRKDVSWVQGYVTARDRMFQMHTLRSAAKGRLAEYAGAGSLSGDVFLRLLKLGRVAEQMAAATPANDPALAESMDAYTAGVNAYLGRLRAGGLEVQAPEITVFGKGLIYDWSNTDTMAIVRLQTWDLGFGGIVDELALWEVIESLREKFGGTSREGVELDVANFEPAAETATLEPDGGASQVGSFDLKTVLDQPFFKSAARRGLARQVKEGFESMGQIPMHRAFSGGDKDSTPGSNNWVISGDHTESGRPIVSNDTHLALRNPAIFYHVQLSTKLAGGDLNVGGVNFAGAPGVVLGHNDHAAWGATVFYSDVTDFYVEKLDPTKSKVWFKGAWVDLVKRKEAFEFLKPDAAATCVDAAPAYVKALEYTQTLSAANRCRLEITVLDVPHHGPIIPWSFRTAGEDQLAVSWKWTGFEPTEELSAVHSLATVASFADFKAALDHFGVGAQNWIYGGTDGDIGWYPSHNLPIRKNIAAGNYNYPPFLPMPGDTGDNEWDGFLPRDEIPQAYNPAQGYLITANADPTGISFDNDPFNDGPYIGYAWTEGYRVAQITKRITALLERSSSKLTPADMQAVQADHRSNLGADLAPVIVLAIESAASGEDTRAKTYVTAEVQAAADLLADWAATDYEAADGVLGTVSDAMAKSSAATAIFNAFLPMLLTNALKDEGYVGIDRLGNTTVGRFLFRLFTKPQTMASYDGVNGVSPLWDDLTTTDVVETKEEIIAKSLSQAVAFLKDPAKVGVAAAGGFGTADMTQWRWGKLHTVKLRHNISPMFDIPAVDVLPEGFPRGGDNFTVDAPNPGFFDTNFTYASGAAIRNVYELNDTVSFLGVIPGGQSENPQRPHYSDEAFLWAENKAPKVAFTVEDVLAAKERTVDFLKKP